MKRINFLEVFGIFIVIIGLLGILYILGDWTGYAIFSDVFNDSGNKSIENKTFEINEIGNVVVKEGTRKTIIVNVKNTGNIFLNNCRLIGRGNLSSWIYSDSFKGLAPGQKEDFVFYLNVPESVQVGDYNGEIEINCDEDKILKYFNVSVFEKSSIIEVLDIKQEKKDLNITYIFNNQDMIGESAIVEIWIENSENETKRIQDIILINKDSLIERNIIIKLPENSIGMHYIYFALNSDLEDYIKESILLKESFITGEAIFEFNEGKAIYFVIFLVIIGIGILFIIKGHSKEIHQTTGDKSSLN